MLPLRAKTKKTKATLNVLAGWQSGHAAACKAVDAGSIPTSALFLPGWRNR